MRTPFATNFRRGSALLIALWALAIMSFAILGTSKVINARFDEDIARAKETRALELARCGLALAMHPNVRPGESILKQELAPGESFDAELISENSRLQINAILQDSSKRIILHRLFNLWGLSSADSDTVIDCLTDWVDTDDNRRLSGAEEAEYIADGKTGYPANGPFHSVEEMSYVKNIDLLEKIKPDWRDYFTVWSDGKIDANEAPAEIISAVFNVTLSQAEALVRRRNGVDGEPHTVDDVRFSDVNQVRIALGMTEQSFQSISSNVTIDSSLHRINSTGKVGTYRKTLSVVVRVNNQTIQYLEWLEQ